MNVAPKMQQRLAPPVTHLHLLPLLGGTALDAPEHQIAPFPRQLVTTDSVMSMLSTTTMAMNNTSPLCAEANIEGDIGGIDVLGKVHVLSHLVAHSKCVEVVECSSVAFQEEFRGKGEDNCK